MSAIAWNGLTRALRPLRSRKVRVALATVTAAYLADAGLEVREEVVRTILGVGAALILGIAHEDAGGALARGLPAGHGDDSDSV